MHAPPTPGQVLEQLATPLVLLGRDLRIRWVNPAFARWLGLSARRFVQQPLNALNADPSELAELIDRAGASAEPVRAQRVRLLPTPEREVFADALATSLAADPDAEGYLIEFHPTGEFAGPDPLTTVPAALHQTLTGLAHEVRNPLAGLRGAAQLLGRRVADPDAQRYLEVITAEADRLAALVERLLEPAPPRPHAALNVHEALERVRVLGEADAGWSVVIQRDYDPSLPPMAGDADRLTQALWNLVRNAIEAGASEVRLRTRAEHNVVIADRVWKLALRIEIDDNGRGVPDELAERLFLPLVSGRAEGTGLGLTLAQEVAREHRGSLTFRSRPGHTVFTLMLPVDGEDSGEHAANGGRG